MGNYWQNALQKRIGRRRALAATGAAGAAAAFLAACGGGNNNNSTAGGTGATGTTGGATGATGSKDTSGLLFQSTDETKQAIKGGKYVDSHPLVLVTLDPMKSGGQIRVARRGYSQLFRVTDGVNQPSDGSIEGDLAQSYELSPDKLTLTVKLDPGAGLPPIAPVNGRTIDADDVLFSWNRLKTEGVLQKELVNSLNPAAPIVSMEAPDKQTIVIKMAKPDVTIFPALGSDVLGSLYIIPKEGDGGFEIPRTAIGSGPFYMTGNSEVMYSWKKNPNFKRAKLTNGEPFIDEIEEPVVTDIATGTSQFRAGALYEYGVPANELVGTKKDLPQLLMRATPPTTFNERLFFGQAEGSPFKDERVRLALMKILDRDAFIAAAYNTDNFAKDGLPVNDFWEGAIFAATYTGWYLNPKDPAFGPNAKNYEYSPDDAKALLSAAGHSGSLAFDMTYGAPSPTSFPPTYYTRAEIFLGMIESSGVFNMSRKLIDYKTEWSTERYRFSQGNFNGMTWGPDTAPAEATAAMFFVFNSKGGYFMGGDATLDDLTNKARAEFDTAKRMDLIHQVQQYDAGKMYNEKIGVAGSFAVYWPVLRNLGVYQGGTNWLGMTTPSGLKEFLDPSQPPLKK
jgi:ABC-type transport system substrate-binding protein